MEKYLFTDGTNVIREVESGEELQSLIQSSADPAKVRIWIFSTSEWITRADFNKRPFRQNSLIKKVSPVLEAKEAVKPPLKSSVPGVLKKIVIGIIFAAAIFLVYNFTKVTWRKASPVTMTAGRPANTPAVNVDSVIGAIESIKGQKLDKVTRANLRIRNTWPDLIQLQLNADRDTSREGSRYYHLKLSIDNSTGYNIDNAVVKLTAWKKGEAASDTIHFTNIDYASPAKRTVESLYRGDSVSVSFISLKSKAFNFCYSSDKKSNYGNYNDRWFCKE
jgi:hypothetical protein